MKMYDTKIYFSNAPTLRALLGEDEANAVLRAVISQETAYNIQPLNYRTGEPTGTLHIINGRAVERVDAEEFVPEGA